ncbi:MAG: c-type cytochrome [Actinomycetota bacterium]
MTAAIWRNDLRHYIILLNFIALGLLAAYLVWAVLSPRRHGGDGKAPANLRPFLPDEDLESRRLERVLGWALFFAAIVAISLPLYWLREPSRQGELASYFDETKVERGAVFYARPGVPEYNPALSLQCAGCHGDNGEGGVAPWTIDGQRVQWKAPAINTVGLRYTEDPECLDQAAKLAKSPPPVCEITEILNYGRPGSPMQAWGVEGGGPKNAQAISDIVAYLLSITLKPEEARAQATAALAASRAEKGACPAYMVCPGIALTAAEEALAASSKELGTQRVAVEQALGTTGDDEQLRAACAQLRAGLGDDPNKVSRETKIQAEACGDFLVALADFTADQTARNWAVTWKAEREDVSDGQRLFEYSCARCHTRGWSVFDPSAPPSDVDGVGILGLSGGGGGTGGGIGFNLRDGEGVSRFGTDATGGWTAQYDFVAAGSNPFQPYGNGGQGSGKMPGFAKMLTEEQLGRIISYERYCINTTTYLGVSPLCPTPAKAPPTTTTIGAR